MGADEAMLSRPRIRTWRVSQRIHGAQVLRQGVGRARAELIAAPVSMVSKVSWAGLQLGWADKSTWVDGDEVVDGGLLIRSTQ